MPFSHLGWWRNVLRNGLWIPAGLLIIFVYLYLHTHMLIYIESSLRIQAGFVPGPNPRALNALIWNGVKHCIQLAFCICWGKTQIRRANGVHMCLIQRSVCIWHSSHKLTLSYTLFDNLLFTNISTLSMSLYVLYSIIVNGSIEFFCMDLC